MSTLKVNNIDTQTGTTISVASGKVLTQPGSVIQVVRKTVDQSGHASSTSSSYTDIASSSLSITPKFANSMIRYSCSIYMHLSLIHI